MSRRIHTVNASRLVLREKIPHWGASSPLAYVLVEMGGGDWNLFGEMGERLVWEGGWEVRGGQAYRCLLLLPQLDAVFPLVDDNGLIFNLLYLLYLCA